MPENPQSPELELIPDAIVDKRRRRASQLIWLIPVLAALIGLSLAIKSYMERGPVVTITFKSGEGIEAGKTKIKYKDVQIGEVKSVTISKDRSHIVVTAEFKKEAEELLLKDTLFWVVKARISGGTVSGLGTLMGGSYIGMDVGKSKVSQYDFTGLDEPPAITMDEPGSQFKLHAADIGSLNVKSPLFFRRIQVGEVIAYELDKDGKGVTLNVFIRTPYDRFVKANTLFWHASGIDFTMDASGLKVNSESMVSLLLGGIAFQAPEDSADTRPAPANSTFTLFTSKEEALKRIDSIVETYLLVFKESVRGLAIGAPVDLRGVTVGEVSRISVDLDTRKKRFVMPVEVRFYPERLRAHSRTASQMPVRQSSKQLIDALVSNGMRAQIRNGNLLTGQLYIALDFFPKTSKARVDWSKKPPEFPTTPGNMEQFQTMLMQIVQKIEKLPLEELSGDTRKTLQSLEITLKNADRLLKNVDAVVVPETRLMLEDARKTLNEANKALAGAKQTLAVDAPLQQDLRETLREVSRAAQSLRVLGDYLERHPEALISGKKEDGR
jgi:paraquat-inducible protein B